MRTRHRTRWSQAPEIDLTSGLAFKAYIQLATRSPVVGDLWRILYRPSCCRGGLFLKRDSSTTARSPPRPNGAGSFDGSLRGRLPSPCTKLASSLRGWCCAHTRPDYYLYIFSELLLRFRPSWQKVTTRAAVLHLAVRRLNRTRVELAGAEHQRLQPEPSAVSDCHGSHPLPVVMIGW